MNRFGVIAAAALAALVFAQSSQAQTVPAQPQAPATAKAGASPVNVNTATAQQLEDLPGIGRATAARIVEYRQKNGPFKKVEDLLNVRGIGEKSFLNLKPLVTVGAAKPAAQQ